MKRILATLVVALGLASCGGGSHVAYRPIAFGENNQCYYVNDPIEAQVLMERGLCDRGWAPTVMPLAWHSMYYPYYASPAYYNVYVPRASRTVYINTEKSWGSSNRTAIATATKAATYKGSNGKTVTAEKIGATKYGAGNRFGKPNTKFGGGSRNAVTPAPGTPTKAPDAATTPASPSAPAPKATPSSPSNSPGKPASPKSPSKPSAGKPSSGSKSGGGSKSYGGGSRGGSSGGGSKSYGGGRR